MSIKVQKIIIWIILFILGIILYFGYSYLNIRYTEIQLKLNIEKQEADNKEEEKILQQVRSLSGVINLFPESKVSLRTKYKNWKMDFQMDMKLFKKNISKSFENNSKIIFFINLKDSQWFKLLSIPISSADMLTAVTTIELSELENTKEDSIISIPFSWRSSIQKEDYKEISEFMIVPNLAQE